MPLTREAQNKISRVLERLDQGEELISGYMHLCDQFCILGLFADESGLGEWSDDTSAIKSYKHRLTLKYILKYILKYMFTDYPQTFQLNRSVVDYYGLRDPQGSFSFDTICDPELRHFLLALGCKWSLVSVNDTMIRLNFKKDEVNKVLSEIIRAGGIYK